MSSPRPKHVTRSGSGCTALSSGSWCGRTGNDEALLVEARYEIARSVARARGETAPTSPDAVLHYLNEKAPPVYDPFCGGGSIPLEAQRLGLRAVGSDLNPWRC